eukprot:10488675-Alexandrium_andersonii.AAC.1
MARATSPLALWAISSNRNDRPASPSGCWQPLAHRRSLHRPFLHVRSPGAMERRRGGRRRKFKLPTTP